MGSDGADARARRRSLPVMGKALLVVGGFLAFCFLVFGGIVFVTRDEDRVAVDALLAERLSKAVVTADEERAPFDLRDLTPFDWDRVYLFPIDTPRSTIDEAVGFEFKGDLNYTAESSEILVFTNNGGFVRFTDYRGRRPFRDLQRPVEVRTANDAVFDVREGIVTPAD